MEGSVVIRRSLGRQLKALRLAAGKTLPDVTITKIVSRSKLTRIEAGASNVVRVSDVISLCHLYKADESTSALLVEMAMNTGQESWWDDFADVLPTGFGMYVDLEGAAEEVWAYSPNLVPGLLQTPEYHRAVFQSDPVLVADDSLEGQLKLRAERQRRAFDRVPPLRMVAVLEEGALRRAVGGKEVMRAQIEHMVEMSERDNVDVLILPDRVGAHPGMKGAFNRLGFGSAPEPDVIYSETLVGGRLVEQADQVDRFTAVFGEMRTQANPIKEHR